MFINKKLVWVWKYCMLNIFITESISKNTYNDIWLLFFKASAHQKNLDIGANLFIGNLDPEVDEKLLYDTFSAFGIILQVPKIMRDNDTNSSKGFAFINFASFDAAGLQILRNFSLLSLKQY